MAEKINFTMAALAKLKPPESGRRWVYDTKVHGLGLQLTAAGGAVFYLYRWVQNKPVRIRLGALAEITVDKARDLATRYNASISDGDDPSEAKRKQRGEWTLQQLFDHYIESHAIPRKKASSLANDRAIEKRYLSDWRNRKLSKIANTDIRDLHAKVGRENGKYAANRLLALLSTMFNVGIDAGEWKRVNPCRGVKMFAEKSRDRFLQPEEIPRFLRALDQLQNQQIADAFRLMLLTGARKGNILAMRWDDLNLDQNTWRVPDTKANTPQLIHLPGAAVEILTALKEARKRAADENDRDNPWVFPSRVAGAKVGHLQDVTANWKVIREKAELPKLRMHDLRRSLGSWMAANGASLQIIGKVLGHHDTATTAIYSRLNLNPVRGAVDAAVAAMLATKNGDQPEKGEQP